MVSKKGLYQYCLLVLVIFVPPTVFIFPRHPTVSMTTYGSGTNVTLYATPNISCQIRSYVILTSLFNKSDGHDWCNSVGSIKGHFG